MTQWHNNMESNAAWLMFRVTIPESVVYDARGAP